MRTRPVQGYPGTLRPLWVIAGWLERSERSVRNWYNSDELKPTACDVKTRALLFDMTEAAALSETRPAYATSRHAEHPTVLDLSGSRVEHPF